MCDHLLSLNSPIPIFVVQMAAARIIPDKNIELKKLDESPENRANNDQNVKPQIIADSKKTIIIAISKRLGTRLNWVLISLPPCENILASVGLYLQTKT